MERQREEPIRTNDIASSGAGGEAGEAAPREETPPAGPPPTGGSTWQRQSPSVEEASGQQPAPAGAATSGAAPPAPGSGTGAAAPVAPQGSPGAPAQPTQGGVERTEGGGPPTHADPQGAGAPATQTATSTATPGDSDSTPLLPDADASDFERRWQDVQVGFVDEPQRCVQEADELVAEVMQRLADGFARERKDLEAQWASGGEASTEDLRVALQRYRSFFNRLLRTS